MSRRLLVMACSATKTASPGYVPARERYDGPLWQTLRTVDPAGELAFASVLSAHIGWKPATVGVLPYDRLMTPQRVLELKHCGIVGGQPIATRSSPAGTNACQWLYSATIPGPFEAVCIVGGFKYVDVATELVTQAKYRGYIEASAPVVIVNDQIGLMRRQLKAWLLTPHESAPPNPSWRAPKRQAVYS